MFEYSQDFYVTIADLATGFVDWYQWAIYPDELIVVVTCPAVDNGWQTI